MADLDRVARPASLDHEGVVILIEDQHPAAAQTSASGPATAAAIKAGRPGEPPGPQRVRDENGNLAQPAPYYVQASCELSEDYFLTDDVVIGADDKVMPFSVADTFSGAAGWRR